MRVLLLTETYNPVAGGETQARALAQGLAARGVSVIVVTRRWDGALPARETCGRATVYRLPPVGIGRWRKWALLVTALWALWNLRHRYDLVPVSGFRIVEIPTVWVSRWCGKVCILNADRLGEMSGDFLAASLAKIGLRPSAPSFSRRVFVFGNGGSALTASHHVADYVKTASVQGQPRLQAFWLNDNGGLLTAVGNDLSYDDIFRWPLEAYARPGDIAVAISASGNSLNVVRACRWARSRNLLVVCLTGFSGGKLAELADIHIHFPCDNFGVIEDLHMAVGHIAAQSLRCRILASLPAVVPER
jgi:D-sedoheptulose 7-phosphate isomerase